MRTTSTGLAPSRGEGWKGRLRAVARAVRETCVAHPGAFCLVAGHSSAETWLRSPLCDPTWATPIVRDLRDAGFDEVAAVGAVGAYHDLAGFLLGHLLPEAARDAAVTARTTTQDGLSSRLPRPGTHRTQRAVPGAYPSDPFDQSLDRLLDHLPMTSRRP